MAISKEQQGTIEVGTRLVGKYKGTEYFCDVIENAEQKSGYVYRLEDGREFKSPSAAGAAIFNANLEAGAKERTCNGWAFFSIVDADGTKVKGTRPVQKRASKDNDTADGGAPTPNGAADDAEEEAEEDEYECGVCHNLFPTIEEATAHMETEHQMVVSA